MALCLISHSRSLRCFRLDACVFFTPMTRYALCASSEMQPYLPHVTSRVPGSFQAKCHVDRFKTVDAKGIPTDRQTHINTQTVLLLLYRLASLQPATRTFQLALQGYSVASLPWALRSRALCTYKYFF